MNTENCVFVGSLVPDSPLYISSAFSRAGNNAQNGFINGLIANGFQIKSIVSFKPTPSWPRSKVMFVKGERALINEIPILLLPYINLPIIKNISLLLSISTALLFLTIKFRVSTIFTYNFYYYLSLFPLLLQAMKIVKYVPIIYDLDIPGETIEKNIFSIIDYKFTGKFLKFCDHYLTISKDVEQLSKTGKFYHVIEGGLGQEFLKLSKFNRQHQDSSQIVIFFAGALELYNGIDVIIEAVKLINTSQVKLIIAGKGSMLGYIENACSNHANIEYVGYINSEQLLDYYRLSSILINHRSDYRINSRFVFPSKLIEYMSTGIPVISTNFSSLPPSYEKYLYLIDKEDAQTLADAIYQFILDRDAWCFRAQAARDFVLQNKTWEKQISIYRETLTKYRGEKS